MLFGNSQSHSLRSMNNTYQCSRDSNRHEFALNIALKLGKTATMRYFSMETDSSELRVMCQGKLVHHSSLYCYTDMCPSPTQVNYCARFLRTSRRETLSYQDPLAHARHSLGSATDSQDAGSDLLQNSSMFQSPLAFMQQEKLIMGFG